MTVTIQTLLLMVAVLVVVAIVARRLNIAPSIFLVIAGILLADLLYVLVDPRIAYERRAAA